MAWRVLSGPFMETYFLLKMLIMFVDPMASFRWDHKDRYETTGETREDLLWHQRAWFQTNDWDLMMLQTSWYWICYIFSGGHPDEYSVIKMKDNIDSGVFYLVAFFWFPIAWALDSLVFAVLLPLWAVVGLIDFINHQ